MSIDDLTMTAHKPHAQKPPATDFATIARHLPDTLVAQIFGYLSLQELLCFSRCKAPCSNGRTVSDVANIVLYKDVRVETKERLESLRRGHPDPESFAYLVECLSIPGFATGETRDYLSDILAKGSGIRRLLVGHGVDYPIAPSSTCLNTRYVPEAPKYNHIRSLTIGRMRRDPISASDPFVNLKQLSRFSNLTELRWVFLDSRLGSVQKVLRDIHGYCPHLKFLQAPWTNQLDGTPWSSLPDYQNLKMLMFRFPHGVRIDVQCMYDCLTEFWARGVGVRLGSGACNMDIVKWLDELYNTIYRQETARGENPAKMFQWLFQHNRHKLIKTTELYPGTVPKMYEGLSHVDASDDDGLGLEIEIKREALPAFVSPNCCHLRLLNTRVNIDPQSIRNLISSNPRLSTLGIAVHIHHHGTSYDGNITKAKVPLIPGQNTVRSSGARTTIPGFEIRYYVVRDLKTRQIHQQWKSHTVDRVRPVATELPDLNIFNVPNFVPEEWTDELLRRLRDWEREIKAYFDLNPVLRKVFIILNTDRQKFGRFESLCSCART